MICLVTGNVKLREDLVKSLSEVSVIYREVDPASDLVIPSLYHSSVTAIVVDSEIPQLRKSAWLDMLGSLGRRIPVFVLGRHEAQDPSAASRNDELLAWIDDPEASVLFAMLQACGAFGAGHKVSAAPKIPVYNMQVPLHMLQGNGALSMLMINASGFRKISIEYGVEAYQKLQDAFHRILFELWGQQGNFRRSDMVMRRSTNSNTYYVFLEQSRISRSVPAPGVLEKMADRITLRLQQALWAEIFKPRSERRLPDCINVVPDFSLGHATALHNPCLDSVDVIEHLIETSAEISKVHLRRIRDREREILQTVVQSKEILYPNYQAVFDLQKITKEAVDEVTKSKSIAPIKSALYGFESLIRARQDLVEEKLSGDDLVHLDYKLLRPDILFAMAAHSKVALELDQLCLGLGVAGGVDLPGLLMVNILPRNLMHLERLTHLLSPRGKLVFEISESEGFSNPKLMERIREYAAKINCSIAADDFGKGHGSIERVIKMRPELIKLDRSLVEKIHLEPAKKIFVEGIVKAAKTVRAAVLAEGIETWEEAQTVQKMGVDLIQGFLLHKPQPLELILDQIKDSDEQVLNSVA